MLALAPFAFSRAVDRARLETFIAKKSGDRQDPAGYAAQVDAVLSHDTGERLAQIHAPTLVLAGDDDAVIPAPSSLVLDQRIPDSRLHTIHGAGHLFFIEKPAETYQLVSAFLAGTLPTGA
jgi:pimeloyl-ACP methyl ester carboxylesterase